MAWFLTKRAAAAAGDQGANTLLETAQECNSFRLVIESSPWELGEGKTQRVIVEYDPNRGDQFPDTAVMASFAIAQEWANRLGEKVRLSISCDHPEVSGGAFWAVKEFLPVPDGRFPEPLPRPRVEFDPPDAPIGKPVVLPIESSSFWPMACAYCTGQAKKSVVITTNNGYRMYYPVCRSEDHLALAVSISQR